MVNLAQMVTDNSDPEMRQLAEEEFLALKERIPVLERAVQIMLLPKDEADEKNAILEVRAGTGGDEAALFAADLFRDVSALCRNPWLAFRGHEPLG